MRLIRRGLTSFTPVTRSIAAKQESGIMFRIMGKNRTQIRSSMPWKMADNLVWTPALMLTELRTMTEVMGIPPIMASMVLPTPWAISSRFGGEVRCWGSNLSTAFKLRRVSSDATKASIIPAEYTAGLSHWEKSGDLRRPIKLFTFSVIGTLTK